MDGILIAIFCVLGICLVIAVVKAVSLSMTRSKLLLEEMPFTVYATVKTADEAEYVVRSAMERIKWLDLYGMCRVVCLNPGGDAEIDAILHRLTVKYPFAEIGTLQTRKNVL